MNNYQYSCNTKNECCNLNQNMYIVDLIEYCINNKCGLNQIQNLKNNPFDSLFKDFDIDGNIMDTLINKYKGLLRKVSTDELDMFANLCSSGIRVRGPATYLLYNSSIFVRITSGSPYISVWELNSSN